MHRQVVCLVLSISSQRLLPLASSLRPSALGRGDPSCCRFSLLHVSDNNQNPNWISQIYLWLKKKILILSLGQG